MQKTLLLFILLFSLNSFPQKDSIVSYLNRKFEIISKKNDAKFLRIAVKKDSLWQESTYYRDGNLYTKRYFKNKGIKLYVGKYLKYHRNGKLAERVTYNQIGNKSGSIITWFLNGNKNFTGKFNNGLEVGLWKYYHYNGNLAGKFYSNNYGELEKHVLYDINGNQINEKEYIKYNKPLFNKGIEKFNKKIKEIPYKISYRVNTTIYVDFDINVQGEITNIWVVNNVPKKLEKQIKKYLSSIKGWKSAVHMNRKVPYDYSIALIFKNIDE